MLKMFKICGMMTIGAATLLAQPAASFQPATTGSTEPQDEIEVLGRRMREAEARREANDFVRRAGVANSENPVARWNTPVCPKVLGIQPEYAAIVESKVRAIAATASIDVAPAP